jgi:glycosyltransferase involved in cell wall biosynthesis
MQTLQSIPTVETPAAGLRGLRVLHVIGTLNPAWGGPVEGVRNLAAQARARGIEIEVVCTDDPRCNWLPSWGIKVHAVGPGHLGKYGFSPGLDRWLAANAGRFDVIVVNGIWMYFGYAVWKAARRVGTPYFLFIHGALDPWFRKKYPLKHVKKNIYWKLFEHKVLRDAERTLFTTEEEMVLADRAFLPYECRPEISGYGIERPNLPDAFDKASALQTLTGAYPALGGRKFILFLARIHEKKGIDLLLKAFAACRQALPGTALMIAGPGDHTIVHRLQNLAYTLGIAADVVWTGPLYGSAKWDAMRAAEVYALPSHQENFGISVVEALACGVPVLVSDKVNIWREIKAAGCGLVESDDIAGATRLLETWTALPDQGKLQMSLSARRCFADHFDIATASDRFFAMLSRRRHP